MSYWRGNIHRTPGGREPQGCKSAIPSLSSRRVKSWGSPAKSLGWGDEQEFFCKRWTPKSEVKQRFKNHQWVGKSRHNVEPRPAPPPNVWRTKIRCGTHTLELPLFLPLPELLHHRCALSVSEQIGGLSLTPPVLTTMDLQGVLREKAGCRPLGLCSWPRNRAVRATRMELPFITPVNARGYLFYQGLRPIFHSLETSWVSQASHVMWEVPRGQLLYRCSHILHFKRSFLKKSVHCQQVTELGQESQCEVETASPAPYAVHTPLPPAAMRSRSIGSPGSGETVPRKTPSSKHPDSEIDGDTQPSTSTREETSLSCIALPVGKTLQWLKEETYVHLLVKRAIPPWTQPFLTIGNGK